MQRALHRSLGVSILAGATLLVACGAGGSSSGDAPQGDGGSPSSMSPESGSDGGLHDDGGNVGPSGDSGGGQPDDAAPSIDSGASSTDSGPGPAGDAGAGPGPYGSPGPDTVTTASFSITSSSDTFTTTAYIPGGAGPFPVVILSSGFEQTGMAYAPYANRLASWGIITFLRDDPGCCRA